MGKWVDQVLRENDSSKFSAKHCQTESLHPNSSSLLSLIGTEITTEHFPREQADALIAESRSVGLELSAEGAGGLRVRHRTNAAPDEMLIARLANNKLAVIEELRRESDVMQYAAERGLYEAEWRVAGCFSVHCARTR